MKLLKKTHLEWENQFKGFLLIERTLVFTLDGAIKKMINLPLVIFGKKPTIIIQYLIARYIHIGI